MLDDIYNSCSKLRSFGDISFYTVTLPPSIVIFKKQDTSNGILLNVLTDEGDEFADVEYLISIFDV